MLLPRIPKEISFLQAHEISDNRYDELFDILIIRAAKNSKNRQKIQKWLLCSTDDSSMSLRYDFTLDPYNDKVLLRFSERGLHSSKIKEQFFYLNVVTARVVWSHLTIQNYKIHTF
jgi:hypothetical protein